MTSTAPRLVTSLLLAALAAGCAATGPERARSARDGLQAAHDRLADARTAAEAARAELDALLSTSGADLLPAYDAFGASIVTLREQARAVSRLPDWLRRRGDTYFERWERDLVRIQDPALRAASASRRGEAMATYNRVIGPMWSGQIAFQDLLSLLDDVRLVLGNDLTPAGVDSVRSTSERVQEETAAVCEHIDAMMTDVASVSEALSSMAPEG